MKRTIQTSGRPLWLAVVLYLIVATFVSQGSADESKLRLSPSRVARDSAAHITTSSHHASSSPETTSSPFSERTTLSKRQPLQTVVSSLAIVLGGFALLLFCFRKRTRKGSTDILETLGTVQLAPKARLHLVRLGSRLLLLHITPGKVHRVTEFTDPQEVQDLLAAHYGANHEKTADHVGTLLRGFDMSSDSSFSAGSR